MMNKFADWKGQVRCCADVQQSETGMKLRAIGLRSEGGRDPVDASLEPEALQVLEQAGIKPGDFIQALVNYHRTGERWRILHILNCDKVDDPALRETIEEFCSLSTTANLPTASWD